MSKKLRVSFIEFLNAVPLGWDFLYGKRKGVFEWLNDIPSQCAGRLARAEADIGLIPVIEYQRIPHLQVIPDISIASRREVKSVLFVSRLPVEQVRTIALDRSSRTSVALLRILLAERFHNAQARLVELSPDPAAMLQQCEAALIIGNPALRVDLEGLHVYDLAREWNELTGLPFVFAFWAVRQGVELGEASSYFHQSRDRGLRNVEQIARLYSRKLDLAPDEIRSYLLENLNYSLDSANLRGLRYFFDKAAHHGLIGRLQPLRFVKM